MHLKLNLLPVTKRMRLDRILNMLLVKDILQLFIITGAILAIALLWSYRVLEDNFTQLADSATRVNREFNVYNQDVKRVNDLTHAINTASKDYLALTPKLVELASLQPGTIQLTSIRLDRNDQLLIISGIAQTRDALLQYQDILQTVEWLSSVQTPASQLFQKENISFEFRPKINFPLTRKAREPAPQPAREEPLL